MISKGPCVLHPKKFQINHHKSPYCSTDQQKRHLTYNNIIPTQSGDAKSDTMSGNIEYLLYELPAGYAVFSVKMQGDMVGLGPELVASITDLARFGKMVKLVHFSPLQ